MSLSVTQRRRNDFIMDDPAEESQDDVHIEMEQDLSKGNSRNHNLLPDPPTALREHVHSSLLLQEHQESQIYFDTAPSKPEILAFEDLDYDENDENQQSCPLHTIDNQIFSSKDALSNSERKSSGKSLHFKDGKNFDAYLPKYISANGGCPSFPIASGSFDLNPSKKSLFDDDNLPVVCNKDDLRNEDHDIERLSSGNTFTTTESTLSLIEQEPSDETLPTFECETLPLGQNNEILAATSISARNMVKKKSRNVRFTTISIRGYNRILGDNPSCSRGPSMSIGWTYVAEFDCISVDKYEAIRRDSRVKEKNEMALTRSERDTLLKEAGYSRSELAYAVRQNVKIKKQRRTTVNNLQYHKLEEKTESFIRKLKKLVGKVSRKKK